MGEILSDRNEYFHIVSSETRYNSDHVSAEPICVNSCGYNYFCDNEKRIVISRPNGRSDYQLIYIQKGQADFVFQSKSAVLKKGALILYKPGEAQEYSYYSSCPTLAYWVHFTGVSIEMLLRQNGLWDNAVYELKDEPAIAETSTKLMREMQFRSYNYKLMSSAYLLELIGIIARNLHNQIIPEARQYEAFIPAINLMHKEYHINRTTEEYASLCGMSACYFTHKFKEFTGTPPRLYLTKIRIEKAKTLLLSTNMSVSEISFSIGYDNPLYFSRLFKKYTGVNPSEFKKRS